MNSSKKLYQIVVAGLLCAIGIVVPMFMPKIQLGPMSFTLASHVAIFIAMFISPAVAVATCIGTTIGFFLTTPPIIALRAASHIVFALVGAKLVQKNPQIIKKPLSSALYSISLGVLHAVCEMIVVTPVFLAGTMFSPEQLANGFVLSVFVLVGCGTLIHSMIDFAISIFIWKPVSYMLHSKELVTQ